MRDDANRDSRVPNRVNIPDGNGRRIPGELARQAHKERFAPEELRGACNCKDRNKRSCFFGGAREGRPGECEGLDLPAWVAPYSLRDARLGYLDGYGETLISGKLSEEQTSRAAEARWGQEGWRERLAAARKRALGSPKPGAEVYGESYATIAGERSIWRSTLRVKLYNTQRCPYARRTRIVLHEKGIHFEVYEVDLANKSEEFLAASPTGKVPVVVVDGDSIYESNVVNQYLDQVTDGPKLMPEEAKRRAYARIWMAFADTDFFPAVFMASVGRSRGFSEERISEAIEKLERALGKLEERLEGRDYLADGFSLADIAHAGNFVRLRELEQKGEVSLKEYPNVAAWMERLEGRESYRVSV